MYKLNSIILGSILHLDIPIITIMKKITRSITAIILLALGVSNHANAQISVGLTGGVGMPMGAFGAAPTVDFNNNNIVGTAKTGYGGTLFGRYHINDNLAVGANITYLSFTSQAMSIPGFPDITGLFSTMSYSAAVEYYFMTEDIKPYAGIELGFLTNSGSFTQPAFGGSPAQTADVSSNGLAFAPVVGLRYKLVDNLDVLLNIKYMMAFNEHKFDANKNNDMGMPATTFLGINIGVQYTIGK